MKPMRATKFLRTPIRADQQDRMTNLQVREAALDGDPLPPAICPQSLELEFDVPQGTTEVQIAPLWQGELWFLSDDKSANPKLTTAVTQPNFAAWKVVGDLVLYSDDRKALGSAFGSGAPLIADPPALVRYSKVRLTETFLFTTVKNNPFAFVDKGKKVGSSDANWFEKLVIAFLEGRAPIPCPHDPGDETKDYARKDMPSVSLATAGAKTTFRVTVASQVAEAKAAEFWTADPKLDLVVGQALVPATLDTELDRRLNPMHPAASVISAWALFQSAQATGGGAAFASDQTAMPALQLRTALGGARPDGLVYRRIDLMRTPIPDSTGTPVLGSTGPYTRRPYPMHRLNVQPAGGQVEAIRIPLSGRLYLPLDDGDYDVWASPRPAGSLVSNEFELTLPTPAGTKLAHASSPQPVLTGPTALSVASSDQVIVIYAHTRHYDSLRAYWAFTDVKRRSLKAAAKARYGATLEVQDAFVFSVNETNKDYSAVYGLIRQAAGRHRLAPEFLHAVLWREGLGNLIVFTNIDQTPRVPWSDTQVISGFAHIGIDQVMLDQAALTGGANPFIEAIYFSAVAADPPTTHPENPSEQMWTGDVTGWKAAIELVAAELQWRLETMITWCNANNVKVTTEEERRFLAYARYNGSIPRAQALAGSLRSSLKAFVGPKPTAPGAQKIRFNALSTVANAHYLEAAGIYR